MEVPRATVTAESVAVDPLNDAVMVIFEPEFSSIDEALDVN